MWLAVATFKFVLTSELHIYLNHYLSFGGEKMDDMKDIKIVLERIANALESIAHNLSAYRESNRNNEKFQKTQDCTQKSIDRAIEMKFINDFSEIEKFLNSKNIHIKSVRNENEADKFLDKIAFFMGNRYSHIKSLYKHIKRNLNTGRTFKLDLKNCTQEEIASITQLCTNLHQIAFLEEYKYFKSPQYILYAKVNRIPKAINFFTGGWLERYTKTAVIEALKSLSYPIPINYSYLKNPQIMLPNGDDFELDILFKIEDEYFWFEAKTGDYQRYIDKYSKIAKILNLDYKHTFMILTDITDSGAEALRSLFKMNVVKIDEFYETFKEVIQDLKPKVDQNMDEEKNDGLWNSK